MNRSTTILDLIQQDGYGIEIGPSHSAIAPKRQGFNVEIIDHIDKEGLIEKYKDHNVDTSSIEEVDHIWKGEPYSELVKKRHSYDWIIASHVIEHTPNLIRFLNDCSDLLNDNGTLVLAVPDKRYCFDHFRPITSLSSVIDGHFENRTNHTPGSTAEYYLNVISKGGKIAWDSTENGQTEFIHSPQEAKKKMIESWKTQHYTDLHAWCFTPSSFRLLISDLNTLGLINLKESQFYDTIGCEFIISLSRKESANKKSRLDLLTDQAKEA